MQTNYSEQEDTLGLTLSYTHTGKAPIVFPHKQPSQHQKPTDTLRSSVRKTNFIL